MCQWRARRDVHIARGHSGDIDSRDTFEQIRNALGRSIPDRFIADNGHRRRRVEEQFLASRCADDHDVIDSRSTSSEAGCCT